MKLVQDWPFHGTKLVLSKAERATLAKAAAIAEQAATVFDPDSWQWLEWKALAMHANESID